MAGAPASSGRLLVFSLVLALGLVARGRAEASCETLSSAECSGVDELPSASQCEQDSCSCAQQIACVLDDQDAAEAWPNVPGGELEFNPLFFHKRFRETKISPAALSWWKRFMGSDARSVSMPDQTVVIKPAYKASTTLAAEPQDDTDGIYALVKLEGYCPDEAKTGSLCLGGDWFALEVQTAAEGVIEAGSIPNYGKSSFCFSCHAPAEQTADWLWQLYVARKYP